MALIKPKLTAEYGDSKWTVNCDADMKDDKTGKEIDFALRDIGFSVNNGAKDLQKYVTLTLT